MDKQEIREHVNKCYEAYQARTARRTCSGCTHDLYCPALQGRAATLEPSALYDEIITLAVDIESTGIALSLQAIDVTYEAATIEMLEAHAALTKAREALGKVLNRAHEAANPAA